MLPVSIQAGAEAVGGKSGMQHRAAREAEAFLADGPPARGGAGAESLATLLRRQPHRIEAGRSRWHESATAGSRGQVDNHPPTLSTRRRSGSSCADQVGASALSRGDKADMSRHARRSGRTWSQRSGPTIRRQWSDSSQPIRAARLRISFDADVLAHQRGSGQALSSDVRDVT